MSGGMGKVCVSVCSCEHAFVCAHLYMCICVCVRGIILVQLCLSGMICAVGIRLSTLALTAGVRRCQYSQAYDCSYSDPISVHFCVWCEAGVHSLSLVCDI